MGVVSIFIGQFNFYFSSGYPMTRGYQIQVAPNITNGKGSDTTALLSILLNNGQKTWQSTVGIALNTWINVAFTWNNTDTNGLVVFINGDMKSKSFLLSVILSSSVRNRFLVIINHFLQ